MRYGWTQLPLLYQNNLCTTDKSDNSLCAIFYNIVRGTGLAKDVSEAPGGLS